MTKKEIRKFDASKATKGDLLTFLKGMPVKYFAANTNFCERVAYTLARAGESVKKVTVADLKELIVEAQSILSTPAPAEASVKTKKDKPAPVEASVKTKGKSKAKPAPVEDEDEEEVVEKPKKKAKKLGVKTAPQKAPKTSKFLPVASMFPEEIEFETDDGVQTLTRVHDKFRNTQEIRDALENGESLFIAAYWTKRHIKQYEYKETFSLLNEVPKSFPDDLDILNIVLACDTMERVYAMSTYTEAMYRFDKPDFEPVEDEDPSDGSKFTVRVSNGLEFEVYTA